MSRLSVPGLAFDSPPPAGPGGRRSGSTVMGSTAGRCAHRRNRDLRAKGAHLMMRWRTVLAAVGAAALTATSVTVLIGSAAQAGPFGYNQLTTIQKRLVSGTLAAELGAG